MTAYLERRIEILEEKLENIVAVGIITQVNGGSVRVDIEGQSSHDMPVLFPKTQDDKFQFMPDIGEQVVCLFLPFGLEQGFVIGSVYSDVDTPPVDGSDKAHIKFKDGAMLEYDRATHKLLIDLSGATGDVDINCKNINATVTENMEVTATGDVKIKAAKNVEIKADTEVNVTSPMIKMNEGKGVVTGECACMLTGIPHSDVSTKVFAGKE
ncbi:MAG: phage baseplate assembly protein V [Deltaproteobacteria bacterium]|nr:phage baseplate assembly protein V [Deltaproteobacteria bacterium]